MKETLIIITVCLFGVTLLVLWALDTFKFHFNSKIKKLLFAGFVIAPVLLGYCANLVGVDSWAFGVFFGLTFVSMLWILSSGPAMLDQITEEKMRKYCWPHF